MTSDSNRRAVLSAVARILRDERLKMGLSLAAVAARAGISYQMVGFVEKEQRNPTLDTLLRISDALGIDFVKVITRAQKSVSKN
jgi:transcriptional regulator with XRE-family HTH domain